MLKLKNIRKVYETGSEKVEALKGLTVSFRSREFVSILGPSGCGKTTLLNIIGGLDKYTSGDLEIDGRSTSEYGDRDWDTYRNHSIGFVFQSYNLIPHQSVLSNVELALTISGASRRERRRRAADALRRVGLGDQLRKKPNQLSGGQMQRVAIARAIVNDPEILLADEPTGALDSVTSVQIMELLSEIAKDRLVIMVTHNPELADTYSTRIIRLTDGRLTEDTRPFVHNGEKVRSIPKTGRPAVDTYLSKYETHDGKRRKPASAKKASMSFWTALGLSFKNLLTKKTRTILTAFAGSIGIIGIALIQSVSSGVQAYIDRVQEDTLSSYPISIQKENADLTVLLENLMSVGSNSSAPVDPNRVYANSVLFDMMKSLTTVEVEENNLSKFKEFLESDTEIQKYISAIHYTYGAGINFYTKDENGDIYKSDIMELMSSASGMPGMGSSSSSSAIMGSMGMGQLEVFEELLPGEEGQPVHDLILQQYDLIYGEWPTAYNEVVLIVDKNNKISDLSLYALGLKSLDEYEQAMKDFYFGTDDKKDDAEQEPEEEKSWTFEEICAKTYRMVLAADCYQKGVDGTYSDISKDQNGDRNQAGLSTLYNAYGTDIRVTGIIRKDPDALSSMLSGAIGYTSMLTDYMIEKTLESELIQAQLADPTVDVLTGLPFKKGNDAEVKEEEIPTEVEKYISTADVAKRAEIYKLLKSTIDSVTLSTQVETMLAATDKAMLVAMAKDPLAEQLNISPEQAENILNAMSEEDLKEQIRPALREQIADTYKKTVLAQMASYSDQQLAMGLTMELSKLKPEQIKLIYEEFILSKYSENTYLGVLEDLGYVDPTFPSGIEIYAKTFKDKDVIANRIALYNATVSEEDKIEYTDYVALLMSSISTVISAISYVLIAFVAISLIVSSIMISIITYISVLERTKEIGVLRAIGASKSDVSRVFNAETLIEGFVSGAMGIGITLLLLLPINAILHAVTGLSTLSAILPVGNAIFLVAISVILTVVAGLIPSRMAAKRDPVAALRSE